MHSKIFRVFFSFEYWAQNTKLLFRGNINYIQKRIKYINRNIYTTDFEAVPGVNENAISQMRLTYTYVCELRDGMCIDNFKRNRFRDKLDHLI